MYKEFENSGYYVYPDGRVLSTKSNKFLIPDIAHGYQQVTLYISGQRKRYKVHRLVAMMYIDNSDNLPCVNHKDGDKTNNHYTNLEWCSYRHNNQHAIDTGLRKVSKSNSDRWKDSEFRKKTSNKMSDRAKINNVGRKNPRFRYELEVNGTRYTLKEVAEMFNRSYSGINANTKKALAGGNVPFFTENNITPIDNKA